MKSLSYFIVAMFFSTITSMYLMKKPVAIPQIVLPQENTMALELTRNKTRNALSKLIYEQQLTKINQQQTAENIEIIKQKINRTRKPYEFNYQHSPENNAERH